MPPENNESQQAHQDAQDGTSAIRASNPFTLTNLLLGLVLTFGIWASSQLYGSMQDNQKSNNTQLQAMHDEMLQHGFKLDAVESEIAAIRATCMDKGAVDAEIRALMRPSAYNHPRGAQVLDDHATAAVTNTFFGDQQ